MCLICKDYQLGKLTIKEAYRNLAEVYNEEDKHNIEVWEMLVKEQMEENKKEDNG